MSRNTPVSIVSTRLRLFGCALIPLLVLCSTLTTTATPVEPRLMMTDYLNAVFGQADVDLLAASIAFNAVSHTPDGDFVGRAGFKEFTEDFRASFSDVTVSVETATLDGDLAFAYWFMTGSHTGHYYGLDPANSVITINGLAVIRFDEGRIAELWFQYDRLSIIRQIEQPATLDP